MSLQLNKFEHYFSEDPEDPMYLGNHQLFIDDLNRWFEVCSYAFEKASFIFNNQEQKTYLLSDAFISLLGYSKEEVSAAGSDFIPSVMHRDDVNEIKRICGEPLFKVMNDMDSNDQLFFNLRFNYRVRHRNGSYFTLDCFLYPIYTYNGQVHFSIIYVTPSTRFFHVEFKVFFLKENKRFVYNKRLNEFLGEQEVKLNETELSILSFTANGYKEYEIAEKLDSDVNKIKYYKKRILKKLAVNSMPEALYYALKMNIL
ncbi:MAG: PAS domain-containing protein [Bacteroidales bacterium]